MQGVSESGFSIPGISILNGGTVGSTPTAYCHVASGFLTDFRGLSSYQIAKVLQFSCRTAIVQLDFYNLTNSSAILTYNNTYSPTRRRG